MKFLELANYEPLNEVDDEKVNSIIASIIAGTFSCPPILVWETRHELVTGSHRAVAAERLHHELASFDDDMMMAIDDLEVDAIDVSDVMDTIEEEYSEIQYDNLRRYFAHTAHESAVKMNSEW